MSKGSDNATYTRWLRQGRRLAHDEVQQARLAHHPNDKDRSGSFITYLNRQKTSNKPTAIPLSSPESLHQELKAAHFCGAHKQQKQHLLVSYQQHKAILQNCKHTTAKQEAAVQTGGLPTADSFMCTCKSCQGSRAARLILADATGLLASGIRKKQSPDSAFEPGNNCQLTRAMVTQHAQSDAHIAAESGYLTDSSQDSNQSDTEHVPAYMIRQLSQATPLHRRVVSRMRAATKAQKLKLQQGKDFHCRLLAMHQQATYRQTPYTSKHVADNAKRSQRYRLSSSARTQSLRRAPSTASMDSELRTAADPKQSKNMNWVAWKVQQQKKAVRTQQAHQHYNTNMSSYAADSSWGGHKGTGAASRGIPTALSLAPARLCRQGAKTGIMLTTHAYSSTDSEDEEGVPGGSTFELYGNEQQMHRQSRTASAKQHQLEANSPVGKSVRASKASGISALTILSSDSESEDVCTSTPAMQLNSQEPGGIPIARTHSSAFQNIVVAMRQRVLQKSISVSSNSSADEQGTASGTQQKSRKHHQAAFLHGAESSSDDETWVDAATPTIVKDAANKNTSHSAFAKPANQITKLSVPERQLLQKVGVYKNHHQDHPASSTPATPQAARQTHGPLNVDWLQSCMRPALSAPEAWYEEHTSSSKL